MFAAVATVLLCSSASAQTKFDPNAPGQKIITVGSEIKRGVAAVNIALRGLSDHDTREFYPYVSVIQRVVEQSQQQNTDSDGFLLGVYFNGWIQLMAAIDRDVTGKDLDKKNQGIGLYFGVYRALQKRIGIDDATLCNLAGVPAERIKPEMEKWSRK
jgi:hypothetical protein